MTFASATIQGILFTASRAGQVPTITYVNGGTAGFESVSIDSSFNIFITIQEGVSTNTQIVAAVNATKGVAGTGLGAGDLVVASTSSGGTTPLCFTFVPLAGGTPAVAASLTVGPLVVTAVSAGTGGNSIRLKFTGGATAGSEIVTVSSNDITVQIQDGVSSFGQVLTALAASGPAAALVTPTGLRALFASPSYPALDSPTPNSQKAVFVASLSSFTNLFGGLAAASSTTGSIQGVTVSETATGGLKNGTLVTLTPGGTAGSEVVSFDSNGNIFCQIQSGTSTPTQVAAALNGNGTFSATYTAAHSGSTGVIAVYEDTLSGAVGPTNVGSLGFYTDATITTLTTSYQYLPFGNVMGSISLINDESSSGKNLSFSWDGVNVHGILANGQSFSSERVNRSGVYVKYVTASPAFRIMATAQ